MKTLLLSLLGILFVFSAGPAGAQEKTNPNEINIGVARIQLKPGYATVRVNGEEWEDSYFDEDGTLLVVEGMERDKEYVISLTPMDELKFKPAELKITPKSWKLKRLDRTTRQWQANFKLKFQQWKKGEREAWEKKQNTPPEEVEKPEEKAPEKPEKKIPEKPEKPEDKAPKKPEKPEDKAPKKPEKPEDKAPKKPEKPEDKAPEKVTKKPPCKKDDKACAPPGMKLKKKKVDKKIKVEPKKET